VDIMPCTFTAEEAEDLARGQRLMLAWQHAVARPEYAGRHLLITESGGVHAATPFRSEANAVAYRNGLSPSEKARSLLMTRRGPGIYMI